jgi:hypothetical protein
MVSISQRLPQVEDRLGHLSQSLEALGPRVSQLEKVQPLTIERVV